MFRCPNFFNPKHKLRLNKISTKKRFGISILILIIILLLVQHITDFTVFFPFTVSFLKRNTNNPKCQFYASEPRDAEVDPNVEWPYQRYVFNNHLIDMVYLQNFESGLVTTNNVGWNRTKNLLDICSKKGVILYPSGIGLFHDNVRFISSWFRMYGCPCVEIASPTTPPNTNLTGERIWVAVGIDIPGGFSTDRLIIIQTEQMTANNWVDKLRDVFNRCANSPSCVIWEFSESNVRHAKTNYGTSLPTVILPTTLRCERPPDNVIPLHQRPYGYIFFGYTNVRRQPVTDILDRRDSLVRFTDGGRQAEGYSSSKLCISVHYYADDSGLELHRLGQHVQRGCMGLYEDPGDPVAFKYLSQQGVIKFAPYGRFTETAAEIIKCIAEDPEEMRRQQIFVQRWWSTQLEGFDKVLKAFFGSN